jgi:hypothetical protein
MEDASRRKRRAARGGGGELASGGAGRENDVGAGVRITWANMRC